MKVGGRRRIVIPPGKAYGRQGAGGVIGPDETLVFVVDLLGVALSRSSARPQGLRDARVGLRYPRLAMAERPDFRAPKGTQDVLPPESARWEALLATFAGVAHALRLRA